MRYPRPTAALGSWLARIALISALLVAAFSPILTAAQDDFDLPADLEDYSGLQAITANSVDGVNLRAEPDVDSEILMSIADGTLVDLRVDDVNTVTTSDDIRWWPVTVYDVEGWIAGMYLASDSASTDEATADESENTSSNTDTSTNTTWEPGSYVSANTDQLAMRAGPGTDESRIAWLGLGDVVQIVDGPFMNGNSEWWLVDDGALTAYVFGRYLSPADELDLDAPNTDAPSFAEGDNAQIALGSGGANLREEASADADKMESLNEGVVVSVEGGPEYDADGAPWYLVRIDEDTRGFVIGEALESTSASFNSASSAPESTTGATGTFIYPLTGYRFTQAFGCSIYDFEPYNATLGCYYHNGIDLAAPLGTPLVASDGGTVIVAGWCDCGLGYYVKIDHGNGYYTLYGHMSVIEVTVGQEVSQGERIGQVGSTGNSTGPHVHFILKTDQAELNPLDYLPALAT